VSDEVRCARSGYMIPILATDNMLRKKEWAIEFEGPASFFACRHYIYTHTQLAAFYRHTQLAHTHSSSFFASRHYMCTDAQLALYIYTHTSSLGPASFSLVA
jgi:hypothetical protein